MHEKAEKGHEVGQLGRFEFSNDTRDELRDKLGHGRTDSIDELGEGESSLIVSFVEGKTRGSLPSP